MSRIETEIWNPIPEKPGYVRYCGQRKIKEVFEDLKRFLIEENLYPSEYFSLNYEFKRIIEKEIPRVQNIYCYAQWGANEGIYFDVELEIKHPTENRYTRQIFATGKTLERSSESYDRMQ